MPLLSLSRPAHNVRHQRWALDHVCQASKCPWGGRPLPFRIVDDEIYRWLPTVVLGTLDKAANIAMQASMRGFYGAPSGVCGNPEHGFTYAVREIAPTDVSTQIAESGSSRSVRPRLCFRRR